MGGEVTFQNKAIPAALTRISVSSASPGLHTFCVASPHVLESADICRYDAQVQY